MHGTDMHPGTACNSTPYYIQPLAMYHEVYDMPINTKAWIYATPYTVCIYNP